MAKILFTDVYEKRLSGIEEFIFETTGSFEVLGKFLDEHDRALAFISNNPGTPAPHSATGDQSWAFGDGRYRLFFKAVSDKNQNITIYLTHIIDNRQANRDVYPNNSMPTFHEDD